MEDDRKEAINRIKELLRKYNEDKIVFSEYCERRMNKRAIEKSQARKFFPVRKKSSGWCINAVPFRNIYTLYTMKNILLELDDLFYVEKQLVRIRVKNIEELRYKLIFKISNKYNLIVIITEEANILKVVNVIKTSRKIKKEWEKQILK